MERSDPLLNLSPHQLLDWYTRGAGITYLVAAAAQLHIDEAIPQHGANYDEISKTIGVKDSLALYTVLSALTWLGIFEEKSEGYFVNNSVSQLFPQYRDLIAFRASKANIEPWLHLSNQIREGASANFAAFGAPFFQWLEQNPEQKEIFHAGMSCQTSIEIAEILEACGDQFELATCLVDVGGGAGYLTAALVNRWPQLQAILYDRAEVIGAATQLHGSNKRFSFVSGDFFSDVPSGDCFILKRVAFNWPDQNYETILENIVSAMRHFQGTNERALFIIEPLRPTPSPIEPHYRDIQGALLAVTMLLQDGRSRTIGEHRTILARVGLEVNQVLDTPSLSILKATLAGR